MSATSGFKSVIVVGATGNLGLKAVSAFVAKKWDTRVLVRADSNKDKVEELKKTGATLVEGDVSNVESLKKAFTGVDVVVSTISGGGFAVQGNVLTAAKEAGVKRFVPSEFGVDITKSKDITLFGPKIALRDATEKSGIEYTYIVTGFFLDGTFEAWTGFDWRNGKITVLGDGNAKISLSKTDEFTALLPDILQNPKSKNTTVNVVGDTVTLNQAIELFEKATGKTFTKTTLTVDDLKKAIASNPNPWGTIVEQLQLTLATGNAFVEDVNYKSFVDAKLTTLAEYVNVVAKH